MLKSPTISALSILTNDILRENLQIILENLYMSLAVYTQ